MNFLPISLKPLNSYGSPPQTAGSLPVSGRGEINYKNGDRYVGALSKGVPCGNGVMTYSNGDEYRGRFINGQPHGKGELYYADGRHFEGKFSEGARHGEGVHTSANGIVLKMNYDNPTSQRECIVTDICRNRSSYPITNPHLTKFKSGIPVAVELLVGFGKNLESTPVVQQPPLTLATWAAQNPYAQTYLSAVNVNSTP